MDYVDKILTRIIKDLKTEGEAYFEAVFQAFMRFSTNLNFSIRISDLDMKNSLTFDRDCKRLKEELIIATNQP